MFFDGSCLPDRIDGKPGINLAASSVGYDSLISICRALGQRPRLQAGVRMGLMTTVQINAGCKLPSSAIQPSRRRPCTDEMEDVMKKLAMTLAGAVAVSFFSVPAMAQSVHDDDHEQLDAEHAAVHDQLGEIHQEAHEDGLTPWEHQRLHEQLARAHERTDTNIEYQHELEHQSQAYQNRSYNGYGYGSGYGGYGQGYGYNGYGRSGGYYGTNQRGYYIQRRARPTVRYYRYYNGRRY